MLFLDELDAIGFARRKHTGSAGRPLVDQLLQELDSIGSENEGILVLAATNAPWDVDEAAKRPGRFDRLLFVPPPDQQARERILELHLRGRPGEERRPRRAREEDAPLQRRRPAGARRAGARRRDRRGARHRRGAAARARTTSSARSRRCGPSTLEWLATARNYVEFANESGRYDEVSRFLVSREARAWKD